MGYILLSSLQPKMNMEVNYVKLAGVIRFLSAY